MSKKIIGVTVGTPISPARMDRVLKPVKTVNGVAPDENGNVVSGGEALHGSASGEAIRIDDISPITPDIAVKVKGDNIEDISAVKVRVYGKNLLTTNVMTSTTLKVADGSTNSVQDGLKQCCVTDYIYLKKGVYKLTCNDIVDSRYICFYDLNKVYTGKNIWTARPDQPYSVNVEEDCYVRIDLDTADRRTMQAELVASHCMLELGNTATEHESYIEPIEYSVNADGSVDGVKSIHPTTTLMTDTNGAVIDVEYNRDLNKAFAELVNAIIALGGNV